VNRIFHLSFIQGELKSNGITSVLIDGALLGLIREGNLIGWDWDAEIAILDQDFNFQAFERAITNLIRNRFEIKSVSRTKYFKLNLYLPEDPDFIYSIFVLHEKKNYLVRPRFKYPKSLLVTDGKVTEIRGHRLFLPSESELLLEHVYGSTWRTPIQSRNPSEYLSRSVFRWNYSDFLHRIIRKVEIYRLNFRRFLVSKYMNRREHLFLLVIRMSHNPKCTFIEIGSSDGVETFEFLKSHPKQRAYIFEPRKNARSMIQNFLSSEIENSRLIIRPEVVVAEKGHSSNFGVATKENLSHISLALDPDRNQIPVKEILVADLMKQFLGTPIFIKMDLEGYEIKMLNRIHELSSSHDEIVLLIELHQFKYDSMEVKEIFKQLLLSGFSIKFLETSSYPRPSCLSRILVGKPIAISGRRALWSLRSEFSIDLIDYISELFFVYNSFTAEAGKRAVRSIVLSKGVNFDIPRKSFKTLVWQKLLSL